MRAVAHAKNMQPRFVRRLALADAVTAANAALGFLAAVAATIDPELAARLILLAAIADGLDGVVARAFGGSEVGPYLDSLADVASFGVAPAFLVAAVARNAWAFDSLRVWVALGVTALFVAAAVLRLAMYTAYDEDCRSTLGIPTTLAATILCAGVLSGIADPMLVVAVAGISAVLMLSSISYPDLYARDALAMGGVQALAILVPTALSRAFPRALLVAALAYLLLAPRFYWRDTAERESPLFTDAEGKRS